MEVTSSNKYAGWIGLGLLYMWGCAIVPWANFSNSYQLWIKVIAFLGAALLSASGVTVFLYVSNLEEKLRQSVERNSINEADADYWKDQAQYAIKFIEKERGKSVIRLLIPSRL